MKMKRIVLNLVKLISVSCLFCGCATIRPVTDSLIESVGGESELKKFQYYISRDLVLDKTVRETDAGIAKGQAKFRETVQKDRINIGKSTPGVVLQYKSSANENYILYVGFDEKDDNKYLEFANLTNDREAPYFISTRKGYQQGYIPYGGEPYHFSLPDKFSSLKEQARKLKILKRAKYDDSKLPCLLVKLHKKSIIKKSKKTLKGRKIE